MKRKKQKIGKSFDEWMVEDLKDNEEAQLEYLKASFEDNYDCPEAILLALRHVVEARGFRNIAELTELNRENLYRMLSDKGNPRWDTIFKLLSALNIKLVVEARTGT